MERFLMPLSYATSMATGYWVLTTLTATIMNILHGKGTLPVYDSRKEMADFYERVDAYFRSE